MSTIEQSHHKIIVIGSGPAGLTASLYAARADLAPLCIEGIAAGGQLMTTTDVENFPGFPEGIMGPELMMRMRDQAERFGTTFITDDVTAVRLTEGSPFTVEVGEDAYTADAVIIATGATARMLGLESEQKLLGHGVSTCATCDGYFFRDKRLAVIGGGDSAMEEATFLTTFASEVTIIHRRDEYRASHVMLERARANPKISFLEWTVIDEVLGVEDGAVRGLALRDVRDGRTWTHDCEGVFVAIGHDPVSSLFRSAVYTDDAGYVVTRGPGTSTNIEGVFVCGDVHDHEYRQAVTAAGEGCAAALDAQRWLAHRPVSASAAAG